VYFQDLTTSVTCVALYNICQIIAYPMLLCFLKLVYGALEHVFLSSVNHLSVHLAPLLLLLLIILSHSRASTSAAIYCGWLGMLRHNLDQVQTQLGATELLLLQFLSWVEVLSVIVLGGATLRMHQMAAILLLCLVNNELLSHSTSSWHMRMCRLKQGAIVHLI